MPSEESRGGSVRSVDRAVSILQVLAAERELGLSEIGEALGLPRSSVFRLLGTLEARGLVARSPHGATYRLGHGVVRLSSGYSYRHDIAALARPITRGLAERVGETVTVVTCDGLNVTAIDQTIGRSALTAIESVGQPVPLLTTAAGSVFLAFPNRAGMPSIDEVLSAATDAEAGHEQQLADDVRQVEQAGYAVSSGAREQGLVTIAAPIRELGGEVVAALVVSGPDFRLGTAAAHDVADQTVAAAQEISWRNGMAKPSDAIRSA